MIRSLPLRLLRANRGSISLLAAGGLTIMLGGAAFAIDLGATFVESRRLQGIADAAAIAAATSPADMTAQARAAVTASGATRPIALDLVAGRWDPVAPAGTRFAIGPATPNAVRVTASEAAPLFFARAFGLSNVALRRTATAARIDLASFSVGSRLAAIDGGLANSLLGALGGGSVTLSVMDYQALIAADVDLLAFTDALRTGAGASVLSYDEVLAGRLTVPRALAALAATLDASGSSAAATAARQLAAGLPATAVDTSALVDLGPLGAQDHAAPGQAIGVNAFDLARSLLTVAGGARQVDLSLAGSVPGIANLVLHVAVGDRPADSPWVTVTPSGDPTVRTAQARLYIEASAAAPPALALLGGVAVRLPAYVELAEAQARLGSIGCAGGVRTASLSAQTSPGHLSIAEVAPAALADHRTAPVESVARLASAGALALTAQSRVDLAANVWQQVDFSPAEVSAHTVRTISSSGAATATAQSLVNGLSIGVTVAGVPVINLSLANAVKGSLATLAAPVDNVIAQISGLLGLHLGQADLRINGVRCGQAALVA